MSQTLWVDSAADDGIDLGDSFALLADFAEMAHACGEDYDGYPDLFGVPGLTMDGDDVPPDQLAQIRAQAAEFLAANEVGGRARATLEQLAGGAAQESFAPGADHLREAAWLDANVSEAAHNKGDVWQGPSGRWFTINQGGRTVPARNPNARDEPKEKRRPAAKAQKRQKVSVDEVHNAIVEAMSKRRAMAGDDVDALSGSMMGLTLKEIGELKRRLGVRAGGRKAEQAKKLAERALGVGGSNKQAGHHPSVVKALGDLGVKLTPELLGDPGKLADAIRDGANKQAGADRERRGAADGGQPPEDGGQLAGAAQGPAAASADQGRGDGSQPADQGSAGRLPAQADAVKGKLERFEKLFRSRGNGRAADLMGKLRAHVEAVGGEAALAALGEDRGAGSGEGVGYTESRYWADSMGEFTAAYLDRYGITPAENGGGMTVSPFTNDERGGAGFRPAETPYENKLDEAKDLPGLESSEDLSKAAGSDVTHLTADVAAKLDEKYGKGQWIVKTYGDDAFAGQGIYFPQRAAQASQDARGAIWASGGELAKYGFSHLRDGSGKIVGIKHAGGDEYRFGTPEYERTIQGDARRAADQAAQAAPHEKGMELPNGGKQFMVQPAFPVVGVSEQDRAAGKTIVPGEGRVHVVVKNGKAEVIPHSTWLKGEDLPVVFEDEGTKAMAKAAQDAIDALPEKARKGQLYAPDLVKTADGYRVVELNAAVDEGGSGYLWDNPFVIDAYVSHLTGREPGHVRFVRKLLTSRKKGGA
jgi:hypothetical protein